MKKQTWINIGVALVALVCVFAVISIGKSVSLRRQDNEFKKEFGVGFPLSGEDRDAAREKVVRRLLELREREQNAYIKWKGTTTPLNDNGQLKQQPRTAEELLEQNDQLSNFNKLKKEARQKSEKFSQAANLAARAGFCQEIILAGADSIYCYSSGVGGDMF